MNDPFAPSPWQLRIRDGLTALFVVYGIAQTYYLWSQADPDPPDIMMFSGAAVCLIGVWFGIDSRQRMHATIDGLRRTGVLAMSEARFVTLHDSLEAAAAAQARLGAIIVGLGEVGVIITGQLLVRWLLPKTGGLASLDPVMFVGLLVIGAIAGCLVGWLLGQFAAYSRLPEAVRLSRGDLRLQPNAGDGMGGLSPLVRFVRRQAILTLLPIAWIGSWLVLTAVSPFAERYWNWRLPLFLLFGLAVFYGARGFLAPARSVVRLLNDMAAFASRLNNAMLNKEVADARKRIWPRPASFYVFVMGFVVSIVAIGAPTGVYRFFLGANP